MKIYIVIMLTFIFSHTVSANEKLYVEGNTLYYNTDLAAEDMNAEINWDDVNTIEEILLENEEITTIQLNSTGGLLAAAQYISDLVIDFELDTYVSGECSSGCVDIFLAGNKRVLERGSWLGFHKSSWDAGNIQNYYELNKEEEGWNNAFEFSSWLYEDTQSDILKQMKYMLERGVEADFIIQTLQADSEGMWYPRRKQLEAAGVLTD
jgi:hypothetical protein